MDNIEAAACAVAGLGDGGGDQAAAALSQEETAFADLLDSRYRSG